MKELDEYREKLLQRFGEAVAEFRAACLAAGKSNEPVTPGNWSVHQIAVHTRDVDKLAYGARTRRTLAEDNPAFSNFDGDAYMAEHYDPNESLRAVLDELQKSVQAMLKLLHEMPPEGWSRQSSHETQGSGITLQTWVERGLEHLEEHLKTVKKAPAP